MLKLGSNSGDVSRLQRELTAKGYSTRGVDGDFGKLTQAAVKRFQRAHGLEADGVVGPKTAKKLFGSSDVSTFDNRSAPPRRPSRPSEPPAQPSGPASSVRGNNRLVSNIRQVDREMAGTGRCARAVNEPLSASPPSELRQRERPRHQPRRVGPLPQSEHDAGASAPHAGPLCLSGSAPTRAWALATATPPSPRATGAPPSATSLRATPWRPRGAWGDVG